MTVEQLTVFIWGVVVGCGGLALGRFLSRRLLSRRIGHTSYGPSIAGSDRPECRIVIAMAEMQAAGWREIRLYHLGLATGWIKPDEEVLTYELGSTGHHLATMGENGTWYTEHGEVYPVLWRPVTSKAIADDLESRF